MTVYLFEWNFSEHGEQPHHNNNSNTQQTIQSKQNFKYKRGVAIKTINNTFSICVLHARASFST